MELGLELVATDDEAQVEMVRGHVPFGDSVHVSRFLYLFQVTPDTG